MQNIVFMIFNLNSLHIEVPKQDDFILLSCFRENSVELLVKEVFLIFFAGKFWGIAA